MQVHLTPDSKACKSYQTYDRAVAAAEGLLDKLDSDLKDVGSRPRFIIASAGDQHDRYTPVFINAGAAIGWLVHAGYMTVGG